MNRNPVFGRTGERRVIMILADGVGADFLQAMLGSGDLPGISGVFKLGCKSEIDCAVSVFPSTTGPAHLPFVTGRYPGPCNIPGIRWFDPGCYRSRRLSCYRHRSYMGLGNFFLGCDLAPDVRTVFEGCSDHAAISANIRKGLRPDRDLTRLSKVVHNLKSFVTQDWRAFDQLATAKLLGAVSARNSFVFCCLYAADSQGHRQGPGGDRVRAACRSIDQAVAKVGRLIEQQGEGGETMLLLVSDHGMSGTEEHIDLQGIINAECAPCLSHPMIFRGFLNARSSVMVSGNAMAHVYLKGTRNWSEMFADTEPQMLRMIGRLLSLPGIDQVAGKNSDGSIQVCTAAGRARIEALPDGSIEYRAEGSDPFGYPAVVNGQHTDQQMLHLTFDADYPDAPRQLIQIFSSPRCGHLVVTARPGYDLRARYERPVHRGSHGSLHRVHMRVPLLCSHELYTGPKRTVDVYSTFMSFLGYDPGETVDGHSFLAEKRLDS